MVRLRFARRLAAEYIPLRQQTIQGSLKGDSSDEQLRDNEYTTASIPTALQGDQLGLYYGEESHELVVTFEFHFVLPSCDFQKTSSG